MHKLLKTDVIRSAVLGCIFLTACDKGELPRTADKDNASEAARGSSEQLSALDAKGVLNKVIEALGGGEALARMDTGRAVFSMKSENVPGVTEELREVTIEFHFDYPERERRVVRGKDGKVQLATIIAGDEMTIRNAVGDVSTMPAPPPETYVGPFQIGTLRQMVAIRDSDMTLRLDKSTSVPNGQYIVEAESPELPLSRLFVEAGSWRLLKVEKQAFLVDPGRLGDMVATVTEYGEYKRFNGVPVPQSLTVSQNGQVITLCQLVEAEFVDTIDESGFTLPK
jgi:hypothetical protein